MTADNLLRETPWETRNLGMPAYALYLDDKEDMSASTFVDELQQLKQSNSCGFVSARIPKASLHLAPILEQAGFYIVESTVCPYIQLKKSAFVSRFQEDPRQSIPKKFQETDLRFITLERNGTMPVADLKAIAESSFSDDRFHIDHSCSHELANQRFSYWVDDLLANPEITFDVIYLGEMVIGFMARKENDLILAGFHGQYVRAGLGDYLWLSTCALLKDQEYATAETTISINNVPVLNLYGRLGFKFKETQYTFHCWF